MLTATAIWGKWTRTQSSQSITEPTKICYRVKLQTKYLATFDQLYSPVWGWGTPLPPCPFTSSFPPFTFPFLSLALLLPNPSLSTRIVPLRFQAGGRRRRPNLGLVCVLLCNLCYLYSSGWWVVFCSIWFSLVLCVPSVLWHCWLGHFTRENPSPIWPIMCLVGR